ncbi:hypothetical protein K1719_033822 [Acacia pycnantha]|nr:hypothetical protein K1719_033822 [Acacia pycnantha]
MESGTNSSGRRHTRAVHLNLSSPVNVQKGRTLVGRLETDKNLNRGIVISMIKKGWGLDKDTKIHELPDNNAFLFRFPKQDDYIRILKGRPWLIQGALLNIQHWDEFTVFHEVDFKWCPFWIQFHGLPHIAFNSENVITLGNTVGRVVMYEAPKEDEDDISVGNGLGTTHVKTLEDALVAHDHEWDETVVIRARPPPATEAPADRRRNVALARNGKSQHYGDVSAPHLFKCADVGPGQKCIKASANAHVQKDVQVVEIPIIMETELIMDTLLSLPQSSPEHQALPDTSPINGIQDNHGGSSSPHLLNFAEEAATSSLHRIHLKRSPDPQEDELTMNPTKKRLLFLELVSPPAPNQLYQNSSDEIQRVSCRKLKNTIRGSKGKRKVKPIGPTTSIDSTHASPPGIHPGIPHNNPPYLDSPNTADGCHQATIGSP